MSLGIYIGTESLDLAEGTAMELERINPFMEFSEAEASGSYSLPIEVKATEKNLRLLQYAAVLQQKSVGIPIDARLEDNGWQVYTGKIKIEKATININRTGEGTISCYFLTDISSFFQDIKDLKLRDIDAGGNRTFANSVLQYVDQTVFGTHVRTVMFSAPGSYDYAFYPVQNSEWGEDCGHMLSIPPVMPLMNNQIWDPLIGGANKIQLKSGPIVPFPYLKYILERALQHTGWNYTGDVFSDADFQKITLINFRSIHWGYVKPLSSGDPEGPTISANKDPVVFNLADHLPNISIARFLIALKNRLGLWFDIDTISKTIHLRWLKHLSSNALTDVTDISSPIVPKAFAENNTIYALKNNFITGGGTGIDVTKLDYQGEVNRWSDLPAPVEALINQVYLVREENNYYMCNPDNDTPAYEWQIIAANIYDYLPAGYNNEVNTEATTVESVRYNDYHDFIPRIDSPGIWAGFNGETDWGIHLCFFFGMKNSKLGVPYPYACHHPYDSNGNLVGNWSLAFSGKKNDGTEIGLHERNWKPFLVMLSSNETAEVTLYPTLDRYMKLSFSQRIVIAGAAFFIKKVKAVIPYKGKVALEVVRL